MLREHAGLGEKLHDEEFFCSVRTLSRGKGEVLSLCRYEAPPGIFWDDKKYHGEAYPAYAWAVYVAQVAVDTVTYSAEVEEFWAVQEVGRVLHPVLAEGQIEGGIAQGIGYALYEKVVWSNGRMANNQMTNYIMPTAEDVPPIHVFFEEIPFRYGGVRRQRHRRAAARWTGARDFECDSRCDRRCASIPFRCCLKICSQDLQRASRSRSRRPYERALATDSIHSQRRNLRQCMCRR